MSVKPIIVVSGLPRTGTSMMMKMLEAGGIEVITDSVRKADRDNPKGYYELERVKTIKHDAGWLDGAEGKAFKMVTKLLPYLPAKHQYQIILMERSLPEVLASQKKMLARLNKPMPKADDATMVRYYRNHIEKIKTWLSSKRNIDYISIVYNKIIDNPKGSIDELCEFLQANAHCGKMLDVIDEKLYRNKIAESR